MIHSFEIGLKSYFTKGPVGALQTIKSKFSECYGSSSEFEELYKLSITIIIILIILSVILGYLAVNKICKADSERGKNTRLGLYALMLLSGGTVSWVYILLWLLNIDICA